MTKERLEEGNQIMREIIRLKERRANTTSEVRKQLLTMHIDLLQKQFDEL